MAVFKSELKADFANLSTKTELKEVELRVEAKFERVEAKIENVKYEILKWFIGISFVQIGVIMTLVKFH